MSSLIFVSVLSMVLTISTLQRDKISIKLQIFEIQIFTTLILNIGG